MKYRLVTGKLGLKIETRTPKGGWFLLTAQEFKSIKAALKFIKNRRGYGN